LDLTVVNIITSGCPTGLRPPDFVLPNLVVNVVHHLLHAFDKFFRVLRGSPKLLKRFSGGRCRRCRGNSRTNGLGSQKSRRTARKNDRRDRAHDFDNVADRVDDVTPERPAPKMRLPVLNLPLQRLYVVRIDLCELHQLSRNPRVAVNHGDADCRIL
jgi:hypothetical protein